MYRKFQLASVRAFYKNNELTTLMKVCNLYPVNSWTLWSDFLGTHIKINKNKTVDLVHIDEKDIRILDIYYKRYPKYNFNFSKWAYFIFGDNITYIFAVGNDEALRMMIFKDGKWEEPIPIMKFDFFHLLKIVTAMKSGEIPDFDLVINPFSTPIKNKLMVKLPLNEENMNKIKEIDEVLAKELL